MTKIHINRNDFESFIIKKHFLIKKTSLNPAKNKPFILNLKKVNKKTGDPIFISEIDSIETGNLSIIPQLISLYGLPAGLFAAEKNSPAENHNYQLPKDIGYSHKEKRFLYYRRAFLFAHVWFIKSFDALKTADALDYILSDTILPLVDIFVDTIINKNKFPEVRPEKLYLDDTIYDFQFKAMGSLLRSYFFPDKEKMDKMYSDWLIEKCNRAVATDAPEMFKGYEPLISGYLVALKASNEGQQNSEYVIQKVQKFSFDSSAGNYNMIFCSLFFIGLLETKADNYYYASAASDLFKKIENAAWNIAIKVKPEVEFSDALKEIDSAMFNPIENIIEYYKMKNPAIREKEFKEYNISSKSIDLKNVYLLTSEEVDFFIKSSNRLLHLSDEFVNNIVVTKDERLFYLLQKRGIESILLNLPHIISYNNRFSLKKQILTDDKPVQRWLRKSFSIQAELIGETKKREAKNLIFIMDKFHLDEYDKLMIKNNVDITRAETVTVFVFFTKPKGKKLVHQINMTKR